MQAVKKYDPYKGVKLSSYAAWWIRAYILRYILNNHRLVKVGTTQAQRKLFFNLQKEKARLSAMGIEPTAEIIAERLNVPERDVVIVSNHGSYLDGGVVSAAIDGPLTFVVTERFGHQLVAGPFLRRLPARSYGSRRREQPAAHRGWDPGRIRRLLPLSIQI